MLYAIVGMLVIILDQGVKFWVTNHIMLNTVTEPLIPGVISLVRMHNDGAAFSFLAGGGARIYFIILTGVFTLAVILALATNFINGRFGRWCLVLVTAGGLSNCLDRILYGYVVDMFKIELFDFAVFNVADIFITVFCLLFIVYIIFGGEDKKKGEDEFAEDDEDLDRPKLEKRDRKAERRAAKEDKAAAKLEKRDKRRGAKYDEDEEELSARFAGKSKKRSAETEEQRPARSESRRRSAEDVPQRSSRSPRASIDSSDVPARRAPQGKKTRYEEDFEAFMAARPNARAEMARKSAGTAAQGEDPFAAWERANAKLENRHSSTAKAMGVSTPEQVEFRRPSSPNAAANRQSAAQPAPDKAAASRQTGWRPPQQPNAEERAAAQQALRERAAAAAAQPSRERMAPPAEAPRRRAPVALPEYETEAAPAPRAERRPAAPAPKAEDVMEFSLDDILSEFR